MTTIPQRLREIAQAMVAPYPEYGMPPSPYDLARLIKAIAAELEAPAADAVQVVAYEFEHTRGRRTLHPAAEVGIAYRDTAKAVHALVKQRDHIATVAALQRKLDEAMQRIADLENPSAPIVRVTAEDGFIRKSVFYAPGLPDGEHDLWCEPPSTAGYEVTALAAELERAKVRIDELESRWNLCSACNAELGGAK